MDKDLEQRVVHDFLHSGKYDLVAPLWRLCEMGGFPSEKQGAKWNLENSTLITPLLHLKFCVYFTEEAPGCCEDTPQLKPLCKTVYISYCTKTEKFETYTDVEAPDWSAIFSCTEQTPNYEDSFL